MFQKTSKCLKMRSKKHAITHGFNIYIQMRIVGQKKIFLLIKSEITLNTNSVDTSANRRNQIPHLGLHHLNPPSLDRKLTSKGNLGKNTKVLQGTKGCRLKHKFRQQWTIVSLPSILSYAFNIPRGSLYRFSKG